VYFKWIVICEIFNNVAQDSGFYVIRLSNVVKYNVNHLSIKKPLNIFILHTDISYTPLPISLLSKSILIISQSLALTGTLDDFYGAGCGPVFRKTKISVPVTVQFPEKQK